MAEDHTGLYICLVVLIVLVAGCLVVLLYNAGVRLPQPSAQEQSALQSAIDKAYTPEQKEMIRNSIIGVGVCAIIGFIIMLVVSAVMWCRRSLGDIN